MNHRVKIGLIASSGGHLEELRWMRGLEKNYSYFYFTELGGFENVNYIKNAYFVEKIDRKERGFLRHFIKLTFESFSVLRKEKPDVLISTGSLVAVPMLYLGKLMGKKIIFVETIARIEDLSLTGKLIYPIADYFIVQWENLQRKYPKTVYVSGIFGRSGADKEQKV
ncbi:MAG: PssD/Cps14F family polysaccharide biosynthesis glycosyltransferase [Eubacteriales bacterium]|nr:PssD/Cps14F family polysaccharide biosynthesis glycosyltransferase [Eubacteriales bacterium]